MSFLFGLVFAVVALRVVLAKFCFPVLAILCHYVRDFLVAACWIVEWLEMLSVVASIFHQFIILISGICTSIGQSPRLTNSSTVLRHAFVCRVSRSMRLRWLPWSSAEWHT